jgi:hypothetical protein
MLTQVSSRRHWVLSTSSQTSQPLTAAVRSKMLLVQPSADRRLGSSGH